MVECLNCSIETSNPKFCSSSCSAIFNNKNRKKRKNVYCKCSYCGADVTKKNNKYCNSNCFSSHLSQITLNNFISGNCDRIPNTAKVYEFLLRRQNGVCQICHILPEWNGLPLKFIRDHIDGNSSNNHPDNIRLICHNCDSQLDTYKARNYGNGRHSRRQRYSEGKSY